MQPSAVHKANEGVAVSKWELGTLPAPTSPLNIAHHMLFVGNWAKLTDDELTQIDGDREQLKGKLQAKYECAKHKAKQERRLVQCS